jgi:hypothetical protein
MTLDFFTVNLFLAIEKAALLDSVPKTSLYMTRKLKM